MKVTVVIATYGDQRWKELAWSRAYPSVTDADEVLVDHYADLNRAEARNALTAYASSDWIITLDADDELSPGYCDALRECQVDGELKLLTPRVSYVRGGKAQPPMFWPECDLSDHNWMVCGTAFPKTLFDQVGGWKAMYGSGVYNEWEDWELWLRMTRAGAIPVKVPDAVYVAHVNRKSDQRRADRSTRAAWLEEVRDLHGGS